MTTLIIIAAIAGAAYFYRDKIAALVKRYVD
jgi:hypothetical protein